jgi:prepilin-type N-terminal cleavage/methylation domain-containing protein/prepilin-type processing-associated H-X9-DG protein
MSAPDSRNLGFTLIELLGVLAIVGVLAGLSLAAISQARSKARAIRCSANLRQLSLGLSQVTAEVGHFPLYQNTQQGPVVGAEHGTLWMDAVGKGLSQPPRSRNEAPKSDGVWNCPSLQMRDDEGRLHASYGFNTGLEKSYSNRNYPEDLKSFGLGGHWSAGLDWFEPVRESEVVSPSATYSIGDGFRGWSDLISVGARFARIAGTNTLGTWPEGRARDRSARDRHRGFANVAFVDGHLESIALKTLFSDTSENALRRWSRDHDPHLERISP